MRTVDKLKNQMKVEKNLFLFLFILLVIGVLAGSIFVTILNQTDGAMVREYLQDFIGHIENNQLDYGLALKSGMSSNLLFLIGIWLLGISMIGLPIIIIMFFIKTFILGFSVGSMILTFGWKGILPAIIYVFPAGVMKVLILLGLSIYAIRFSMKLIYALWKKKVFDFKQNMKRYILLLGLAMIVMVVMVFYDTYVVPKLINMILKFIK